MPSDPAASWDLSAIPEVNPAAQNRPGWSHERYFMAPGAGVARIFAAACAVAAAGCATLPPQEGRGTSFALQHTEQTRLGGAVAPLVAAHPGKTGIHALPLSYDAFAARVLLAGAAQRSIDAQYYIWRDDQTGMLLFEALAA